jgi:hypothetical protein
MEPRAAPAMGTATLAPGLEGVKPVELGEAGVLPAPEEPEPEPDPEPEPEPEEPEPEEPEPPPTTLPELVGLVPAAVEEAQAPPAQGAVEVTTTVLLPLWPPPVWMGWVPVWAPVPVA